jgi:formate/nitrite transporter
MEARSPGEILNFTADIGAAKAGRPVMGQLILAFMAGAFIAFAAEGSNMAAFNLLARPETYGLGRALAGAVFSVGLMLVLIAGAELFTGNTLIIIGVLEKRVTAGRMLRNWLLVYAGNFAGSVFIAYLMNVTGLFNSGGGLLGGMTIKIATGKTALAFGPAFVSGFLCNWLVCLAVWASFAARDAAGKMLACFFIIALFVISGFEHSIANMYYSQST